MMVWGVTASGEVISCFVRLVKVLAFVFIFAGIAALISIDGATTIDAGGNRPASANNYLFTKNGSCALYIFDPATFHCSFRVFDLKQPPLLRAALCS